jgi:hypothetical protein
VISSDCEWYCLISKDLQEVIDINFVMCKMIYEMWDLTFWSSDCSWDLLGCWSGLGIQILPFNEVSHLAMCIDNLKIVEYGESVCIGNIHV